LTLGMNKRCAQTPPHEFTRTGTIYASRGVKRYEFKKKKFVERENPWTIWDQTPHNPEFIQRVKFTNRAPICGPTHMYFMQVNMAYSRGQSVDQLSARTLKAQGVGSLRSSGTKQIAN